MFPFSLQLYIGNTRSTVLQNQDILKGLSVGMMVATKDSNSFPKLGKVTNIPLNPTLESNIEVLWYQQEKASHKPRWLRFFLPSAASGTITIADILLYDFSLTNKGALKKKSRDYLKEVFSSL